MPVYLLKQAEDLTESREAYKKRKQQLMEELEAYQFTDIAAIRRLARFLADSGLEHISEMDYPLRAAYEQYLLTHHTLNEKYRYIKIYDRVKQEEIAEQIQTLAGKRKYRWCYRNEILYLRYYPIPELAQEFLECRKMEMLVWDFSLKHSEILKRQIFDTLSFLLETAPSATMRRLRLLALQQFYRFCVQNHIKDVGQLELEEIQKYQEMIGEQGHQAEKNYMSIVNICRKIAFLNAEEIQWDATVWYVGRFHFTEERLNKSASLESISFMEIKNQEERELAQTYMKYELGVTGQAISTIVKRYLAIRNFLCFLIDEQIRVVECKGEQIKQYADQLQERKLDAKGYNERLSAIGHFFKFLEVRGYITRVPFRLEYYMQKEVHIHHDRSVETDVYMEIIQKLYRFPERLRCMFLHLWCVGLRGSEVCQLKGDAYYTQNGDYWIKVYQVKMKTYKRIPIPEALYRIMSVYINRHQIQPEDYIFQNTKGGACLYQTFRAQMLKACQEQEILNGEYIFKSHDYRHTVATMFYDNEVSIQSIRDYLGHSYEEMTRQYIDYMPKKIAQANEEFFSNPENSLASYLKGDSDGNR